MPKDASFSEKIYSLVQFSFEKRRRFCEARDLNFSVWYYCFVAE